MGVFRDGGYSASVEGYFVVNGEQIPLAKTNGRTFVFAKPCELAPGTAGELLVIVDGERDSRRVVLPHGAAAGQINIPFVVEAPF